MDVASASSRVDYEDPSYFSREYKKLFGAPPQRDIARLRSNLELGVSPVGSEDSRRRPEKAGVGGSIPSLATNTFNNLAIAKNIQKSSREQYAYINSLTFHFWRRSFKQLPRSCAYVFVNNLLSTSSQASRPLIRKWSRIARK